MTHHNGAEGQDEPGSGSVPLNLNICPSPTPPHQTPALSFRQHHPPPPSDSSWQLSRPSRGPAPARACCCSPPHATSTSRPSSPPRSASGRPRHFCSHPAAQPHDNHVGGRGPRPGLHLRGLADGGGAEELVRLDPGAPAPDRLAQLATHVLEQRSYFPSSPAPGAAAGHAAGAGGAGPA